MYPGWYTWAYTREVYTHHVHPGIYQGGVYPPCVHPRDTHHGAHPMYTLGYPPWCTPYAHPMYTLGIPTLCTPYVHSREFVIGWETLFAAWTSTIGWPEGRATLRTSPLHRGLHGERPCRYPIFVRNVRERASNSAQSLPPTLTGLRTLTLREAPTHGFLLLRAQGSISWRRAADQT